MKKGMALASDLFKIAMRTERVGADSILRRGHLSFMTSQKCYEVSLLAYMEYRGLPQALLKQNESAKRFSVSTVESLVHESIARLVEGQTTIEAATTEVEGLLAVLSEAQPEQIVLYEVPGVTLPKGSRPYLLAGARVTRLSTREYRWLARRWRETFSAVSGQKGKQDYVKAFKPQLDRLKGKTVMRCSYAAEPKRAQELSLETLNWIIILLKYACLKMNRDSNEMAIGLSAVPSFEYFVIPKDSSSLITGAHVAGKFLPWKLKSSDRVRMRQAGVFVLSDILVSSDNGRKLEPESFQFALLQALQWTVTSLDLVTNGSRVLALAVALEALFSPNSSNPRLAVAEGTAMTIFHDPKMRQNIYRRMKGLYDKRCDAAHGRKGSASDWDVIEMGMMVTKAISVLCKHVNEYHSLVDFSTALSQAKLTGQVFKK